MSQIQGWRGLRSVRRLQGIVSRRLLRLFPLQVNLAGSMPIYLTSKYSLWSFTEVFATRTYYPALELFRRPPCCVMDLGAHEGMFTLLVESHIRQRYPDAGTGPSYVLYEANPKLVRRIRYNLTVAGLSKRSFVRRGAVGKRSGRVVFNVSENLGKSSAMPLSSGVKERIELCYCDLEQDLALIGLGWPELIKVDIEGAEGDLLSSYSDVFANTCVVAVEQHREYVKDARWRELCSAVGLQLIEVTGAGEWGVNQVLVNPTNLARYNERQN